MLYDNLLLFLPSFYNPLKPFLKFRPPFILTPRLLNFRILPTPLSIRILPVYVALESKVSLMRKLVVEKTLFVKKYVALNNIFLGIAAYGDTSSTATWIAIAANEIPLT